MTIKKSASANQKAQRKPHIDANIEYFRRYGMRQEVVDVENSVRSATQSAHVYVPFDHHRRFINTPHTHQRML